ncbi:sensor domain-containing diguanylate cyclase [Bacillus sp. B15-48]|uniref:sensor domain-containing diguanylate cyclase n=1 Tax=Bacillus sp. B15-48 TaxID=1548601 RepID=UPI0019400481|nr:sensor domain-containing diguanylate cyclase [Bacillus sp. B15-48]
MKKAINNQVKIINLEQRIKQLEEQLNQSQKKQCEYQHLLDEIDAFAFTIDLRKLHWTSSNPFSSSLKIETNEIDTALLAIETVIHPEDKATFITKKENWLSGLPVSFEFRTLSPDGQVHWKELRTTPSISALGEIERVTGVIFDISNRKEKEAKLAQMALFDALTGLPNRLMLKEHIQKVMSRAKRTNHEVIIMFLDLDGFKAVNDTLGHDIGDLLLKDVADRLNASVREEDLVSRIGGDEFIIVFEETNKEDIVLIAERIVENLSNPYYLTDNEVRVTPSVGISVYPDDATDLNTIINHADTAMYVAKKTGKGRFQFYSPELEDYEHPKESIMTKFFKLFQK